MIALNTATGIIEVNSWQDIIDRPHFRMNINPTTVELKEIIGSYQFNEDVNCGLTTCHQPHKRGYLVMTKEGFETNIGKDCGKNYFSVNFVDMKVKFDRDVKISFQREIVRKAIDKAPELLVLVEELRKQIKGADWLHQKIEKVKSRTEVGDAAATELRKMLKERRKELLLSRLATETEKEDEYAIDPSLKARLNGEPFYITNVMGSVNFIEALAKENDLKEILIRDVTRTLKALIACDLTSIKERDLGHLSKDANSLDSKLLKAREAIEIAKKFLTKDNLSPLVRWIEITVTEKQAIPMQNFIDNL
ncbi:Uncharacterised protein [Yersinia frederiksenii]|uniref:hypothetical protein n=1 Tax=Yersinia frederiksenii TaxID=29484 RepID=UPI0005E0634E|nr:hypothetical protein [Yersinia frederiksenii]CFR15155.1 Uncharacterised protein [Yersinia frederiksenii]